jgi:hypothetical protein
MAWLQEDLGIAPWMSLSPDDCINHDRLRRRDWRLIGPLLLAGKQHLRFAIESFQFLSNLAHRPSNPFAVNRT